MPYVLDREGDGRFAIRNRDSDNCLGSVALRDGAYTIRYESGYVDFVRSLDEVVRAITCHYELNPPQWVRHSATLYVESTDFGDLVVERNNLGRWFAYRNELPLMRGDNPAEFESFEEARGAADTHVRDAYPNSPSIEDGLAWVSDPGISDFFAARTAH